MSANVYTEAKILFEKWWGKHGWPEDAKGDANFTLMGHDKGKKLAFRAYQKGRLDAIREDRREG